MGVVLRDIGVVLEKISVVRGRSCSARSIFSSVQSRYSSGRSMFCFGRSSAMRRSLDLEALALKHNPAILVFLPCKEYLVQRIILEIFAPVKD